MRNYTQQDIEAFKAKYPRVVREVSVYPSDVEKDENGKPTEEPVHFLIKKPNQNFIRLIQSKEYSGDTDKIADAAIKNCVLAGDMEALENDGSVYMGLVEQLMSLIQSSKVELKKV
ncbi:hypothetical protein ACILE2_01630 [Capnocytophaga canimorsus]|uniref:hypothetical protein n=1 Tax=Capnocytophaga canimorsus TaxID=28188 RepID=UPI0037D82A2B